MQKGSKLEEESLDAAAVSSSTPVPDDPFAALSDVTPESEDEEVEPKEPRPLSAEADALLSLMDMSVRRDVEADMKMQEAALALLSMGPDAGCSSDIVAADAQVAMETVAMGPEDAGSLPECAVADAGSAQTHTGLGKR